MRQNLTNVREVSLDAVDNFYIVGSTTKEGLIEGRSNVKINLKAAIESSGDGEQEYESKVATVIMKMLQAGSGLDVEEALSLFAGKVVPASVIPEFPPEDLARINFFGPEDSDYWIVDMDSDEDNPDVYGITEDTAQFIRTLFLGRTFMTSIDFPLDSFVRINVGADSPGMYGGIAPFRNEDGIIMCPPSSGSEEDIGDLVTVLGYVGLQESATGEAVFLGYDSSEDFSDFISNLDGLDAYYPFADFNDFDVDASYVFRAITSFLVAENALCWTNDYLQNYVETRNDIADARFVGFSKNNRLFVTLVKVPQLI